MLNAGSLIIWFIGSLSYQSSCSLAAHIYTVSTKNYTVCFLAITPSNLHQIQKVRSVLKSARFEDFKTVLDFQFWPSRSWDIGVRTHQGSFLVFTFFARNYTDLAGLITLLDSQNLNFKSQNIFSDIFHTNDPTFNKKIIFKNSLLKLLRNMT